MLITKRRFIQACIRSRFRRTKHRPMTTRLTVSYMNKHVSFSILYIYVIYVFQSSLPPTYKVELNVLVLMHADIYRHCVDDDDKGFHKIFIMINNLAANKI